MSKLQGRCKITKTETGLADAEMRLHRAYVELEESRNLRDHWRHLLWQEQIKPKRNYGKAKRSVH